MIVTLTANPALDRTLEVEELVRGRVNRARTTSVHPGGKGVNVARAVVAQGRAALAVLPVGGSEGDRLTAMLEAQDVRTRAVPIAAATRENLTVVDAEGEVTKINAPGPRLDGDEVEALAGAVVEEAGEGAWVALCGSLPPEVGPELYAELTARLHDVGARVAVDTSGAALSAVLDAGPDLIKPNEHELAGLAGFALDTLDDVAGAARDLVERGVGAVLVSLGAEGALLVTSGTELHAAPPSVIPRSDVGAGDATLAGYLLADDADADDDTSVDPAERRLRTAVAFGVAAVQLPGTGMPLPHDLDPDAVTVRPVPTREERT